MTRKSSIALAVLAILVAPAAALAAEKAGHATEQKSRYALDRTVTSSVDGARLLRNCDPAAPDADLVCRITRGNPEASFPSAPSGPFGF